MDAAPRRIVVMHDVRGSTVTERVIAYERSWVLTGFVQQAGGRDAVFASTLPVKISLFEGWVAIEGGAVVASSTVPHTGTHANFMERVRFRIARQVWVTYSHWSNASIGDSNPGIDAAGIIIGLGQH